MYNYLDTPENTSYKQPGFERMVEIGFVRQPRGYLYF